MEKNLYIFRHGQTNANKNNIWQGCLYNPKLNAVGRKQAADLAQKLKAVNFDIIYSSPLNRAKQTAACVAEVNKFSPKIEIIPGLREGNLGAAEGKKTDILYHDFPTITHKYIYPTRRNWDLAFPGKDSESKHQIFDRAIGIIKEITQGSENVIGIATHGGVLNAIACGLNLPRTQFSNCDVLQLKYNTVTGEFTYVD